MSSGVVYLFSIILCLSLTFKQSYSQTCGSSPNTIIGNRILGDFGRDALTQQDEFPWVIQIHNKSNFVFLCAGSLISEQVLVTAGHCLNNVQPGQIEIRAGIKYSFLGEGDPEVRDVSSIVIHEGFNSGNLRNDIGLAFLSSPLRFSDKISTVCIPPLNTNFDGQRCFVAGWGRRQQNLTADENDSRKVDLPVVPRTECQAELRQSDLGPNFALHSSFICAGGELGKDACRGDGGSPLMCPIEGTDDGYYQAGIVSWGIGCGVRRRPGVYTNVSAFKTWIDNQFRDRGLNTNTYTRSGQ